MSSLEDAIDMAEARGVLYRALAVALSGRSDEALRLLTGDGGGTLVAAARLLSDDLAVAAEEVRGHALTPEALRSTHAELFGHTVRGQVPPYETEYGKDGMFAQPHEMGDIAGFMRAFGLVVSREGHQRVDHVGCQCEFMSFLCWKEAYALETGDDEMRDATRHGQRLFLKEHLGRFGPAFAGRVRKAARGFFHALGTLLGTFLSFECDRMEIPSGASALRMRSPLPPDYALTCGAATQSPLVQIEEGEE